MPLSWVASSEWWSGCLWLVVLWAGVATAQPTAATSAPAAPADIRITAETPSNRRALPADEFAAIVGEARAVPTGVPPNGAILLPKAWRHLTRGKLAAMLTMPQFGNIPHDVRQVLIDQAATWDLLDFKRPSDAAALWGRLWSVKVEGRSAWDFFSYIPDATWSPTSLAMASVFACFPAAAWTAEDPIVHTVTHNEAWQWTMGMGGTGIRDCLPNIGTSFVHWTPALRAEVSGILTRKFSEELHEDGCTRHGPDSCLVIFQALYGLDPRNAELPVLLKKMQPSFLDNDIPWWLSATKGATTTKVADAIHTQLIQRMAFITAKLPVLLDQPQAWPSGEIQRVLARAFRTSAGLTRLQRLDYKRYYYRADRDIISPWHWLEGKPEPQVASAMRDLGHAYAKAEGCQLGFMQSLATRAFMVGYIVENIRLGNGGCGLVGQLPLAELVTAGPARRRQLIALFEPIADRLSEDGPLRENVLNQVTDACHRTHAAGVGPFKLCAGVHARDAAKLAARLAAMPHVDPLACPEGTLVEAEQSLSIQPEGDDLAACRRDPTDTRYAIVALAYHATHGGEQSDGDGDYDLDLAIIDVVSGEILAHRHEANGVPSDAVSLDRLWLDTARYDLAPGQRAFGIRTRNDATCYECAYGYTRLSLYLRDGSRLRRILVTTVAETLTDEHDEVYTTNTVLWIGNGRNHGLANIVTSTTTAHATDSEGVAAASGDSSDANLRIWHYDGNRYVPGKSTH